MTNINKAAYHLSKWLPQCDMHGRLTTAIHAAQALADAGLLMPELPGPNDPQPCWVSLVGENALTGEEAREYVSVSKSLGKSLVKTPEGRLLYPDEARTLALSLLAAANYSEGQA